MGGGGDDVLQGEEGADRLSGGPGAGDDVLRGGIGLDFLAVKDGRGLRHAERRTRRRRLSVRPGRPPLQLLSSRAAVDLPDSASCRSTARSNSRSISSG